jgi:hypothetical protein
MRWIFGFLTRLVAEFQAESPLRAIFSIRREFPVEKSILGPEWAGMPHPRRTVAILFTQMKRLDLNY